MQTRSLQTPHGQVPGIVAKRPVGTTLAKSLGAGSSRSARTRASVSRKILEKDTVMTKSYPDRIAAVIAKAPPPPPIKRNPIVETRSLSDLTKRCVIMAHLANATPQFAR